MSATTAINSKLYHFPFVYQVSASSCASAQEAVPEGEELPVTIPEAHPFDPASEAPPIQPVNKDYDASQLPNMKNSSFVSWLEGKKMF